MSFLSSAEMLVNLSVKVTRLANVLALSIVRTVVNEFLFEEISSGSWNSPEYHAQETKRQIHSKRHLHDNYKSLPYSNG